MIHQKIKNEWFTKRSGMIHQKIKNDSPKDHEQNFLKDQVRMIISEIPKESSKNET